MMRMNKPSSGSLTFVALLTVFQSTSCSWTTWDAWSECSLTCGGGASFARRRCVGLAEECEGSHIRYRTCQNEDCQEPVTDFRAMQCAGYDDTEFDGKLYSWIPEVNDNFSPCALYCRARNTDKVMMMSPKVFDGTRCYHDLNDMCINGICQPIGCDRQLNSEKRIDVCGVCGGDGTSCRLVTGLYRSKPGKSEGTEVVITIPQKSRHISVSERGSGHAGLMVNDTTEVDVIFPHTGRESNSGVTERSGLVVNYGTSSYGKEYFDVPGPVPKDTQVVALYDHSIWKYIRYEFYRPLTVGWLHDETNVKCTATCGGGLQYIWPICVDAVSGDRREDKECHEEGLTPPAPKVHRCNLNDCPESYVKERWNFAFEYMEHVRWITDPWTDCSASCDGGVQTRSVSCAESTMDGQDLFTADDSPCQRAGIPLPETRRNCNVHSCPKWKAQDWSECSVSCGPGWQHRVVECFGDYNQLGFHCDQKTKPDVRRPCLVRKVCVEHDVPVKFIEEDVQPFKNAAFRYQEENSISVQPSWVSDNWGDCSVTCGVGVSVRVVKCRVLLAFAGTAEDVEDRHCEGEKPVSSQPCSMGICMNVERDEDVTLSVASSDEVTTGDVDYDVVEDFRAILPEEINSTILTPTPGLLEPSDEERRAYEWRYEEYGPCTPYCGKGTKTASHRCFHIQSGSLASSHRCHVTLKQSPRALPCDGTPCAELPLSGNGTYWGLGPYTDCNVTCGRGIQTRVVLCKRMPEGSNYTSSLLHYYQHVGEVMPDMMCPSPKPQESQACGQRSCDPEWVSQPWSKCSRSCGRGVQHRTSQCMQKLGTGETVRVSEEFCRRKSPSTKRNCNWVHCPPRYVVQAWSQCHATCGDTYRTRALRCHRILGGHSRPIFVPTNRCSRLRRPIIKEACHLKKCVESHVKPIILAGSGNVIQKHLQTKIRMQIGQKALVLPQTIVVIKCRVEKFRKENVRWRYNGQPIRAKGGHVSVLPDGSLRILRARALDSGRYTCVAGPVAAHSLVRVKGGRPSQRRQRHRRPISVELDGPSNHRPIARIPKKHYDAVPRIDLDDVDSVDNIDDPSAVPAGTESRIPRFRPRPVLLAPNVEPPPRLIHPEISYVAAQPILQVDLHDREEPDSTGSDEMYDYSEGRLISSQASSNSQPDVIHSVLQFMSRDEAEGHSESVNELLQQFVETSTSYETEQISLESRNVIFRSIMEKLELLLGSPGPQVSPGSQVSLRSSTSGSSGTAALQNIIRLLQDEVEDPDTSAQEGASIISHPTLSPLQLERSVSAYVGGSLIVAGAERITILCEASGNPKPSISWFRNGNKLPEHRRQYLLPDGSLRLLYPLLSDAGAYTCVASNRHGRDEQTTELRVTQVPRIISTTSTLEDFLSDEIEVTVGSDIRAKLGATITIKCPTEGYPDPYVVWRKDGPGLGQNTKVRADNSLVISPATAAYQGLFGCEASNPAGSDYQASSLVLIDPPRISDELNVLPDIGGAVGLPELLMTGISTETYRVKANSSVMMGCPVAGFPEPAITWFFNEQPITELGTTLDYQLMKLGKVLQIPEAGLETEGVYSCHAQNDGGNLTTRLGLSLIVYTYDFGDMTTCSASCGDSGIQFRRVVCLRDGAEEVDEWFCTGLTRPTLVMQPCNRIDCPPRFVLGPWQSCSVTCGNGTRTRASSCVILMSDGSTREVATEICLRNETQTIETEPCYEEKCPQWRPSVWRSCSKKCVGRGVGEKSRKVYCVRANGTKVHPKQCAGQVKPRKKVICPNPRCEPVWVTSRWSGCSKSCGIDGIKTRILNCVYRGRKRQPAGKQCSIRRQPRIKIPCNRRKCSPGRCVDRFKWCRVAKKLGRCKKFKRVCCHSCR